jgi:hypothetical protein
MIVSHRHEFIFVHCRKVAGSSIKVALAPYLGAEDLVVGSLNEVLAAGIGLPAATRRMLRNPRAIVFLLAALGTGRTRGEAINIGVKAALRPRLSRNPSHPSAEEAASYLGDTWDRYFKFGFVRNPYERVVSDYLWRRRVTGAPQTFSEYLGLLARRDEKARIVHDGAISNWEMIAIGDRIILDAVGRYETLDADFRSIAESLGLEGCSIASRQKSGPGSEGYGRYYTPSDIALVTELFGAELNAFGYEYPY